MTHEVGSGLPSRDEALGPVGLTQPWACEITGRRHLDGSVQIANVWASDGRALRCSDEERTALEAVLGGLRA